MGKAPGAARRKKGKRGEEGLSHNRAPGAYKSQRMGERRVGGHRQEEQNGEGGPSVEGEREKEKEREREREPYFLFFWPSIFVLIANFLFFSFPVPFVA